MIEYKAIYNWLSDRLTPDRLTHVTGVMDTALDWANRLALPAETCHAIGLAALLHDNAKQWSADRLKIYLNQNHFNWQPQDQTFPAVWHAWAGAIEAKTVWGITQPDLLNAIHYHTTARPNMSVIEKVVFVADKIEARTRPTVLVENWQQQVNTLPHNSTTTGQLNNWVKVLLGNNLQYLIKKGQPIHPVALAAWNGYVGFDKAENKNTDYPNPVYQESLYINPTNQEDCSVVLQKPV